ncbi:HAD family hydrolase [Lysinibacillus sp. KU-BSD001]|uniref:HAD family hydrolase n=1 Tax=Lysinibacillus sp. KU-BSD001 TaxID=3141328 RepID=UPI0036DFD111
MIFFDINGTLFNREHADRLATIDFYKEYSNELEMSRTEFTDLWYRSYTSYLKNNVVKDLSFQKYKIKEMKEFFGYHLTDQEAESRFDNLLKCYDKHCNTFDDVVPCLDRLKQRQFRLGIISNGHYIKEVRKLKLLGIHHYFDYIVTASEVGIAKPNPEIFLKACHQANVNPQETYYIGDELVADVIASKKCGMNGIWINRNKSMSYNMFTEIHSLSELDNLIK